MRLNGNESWSFGMFQETQDEDSALQRPPAIPHTLECPVLRLLGACKCCADDQCILQMVLSALALELVGDSQAPQPSHTGGFPLGLFVM